MPDGKIWTTIRTALLLIVDAIEKEFDIRPRTAELRRAMKGQRNGTCNKD